MNDKTNIKQAVALHYNGHNAPKVIATGEGLIAEDIIALAEALGIHIHQDQHLASFLRSLELGEEIPPELYLVIAELIAFVYVLEGKTPERWDHLHKKIINKA